MADSTNIQTGLNITTQIPLDTKLYSTNQATLANLGLNNNKAYTYYQDMFIYCLQERKTFQWREVGSGQANTGLVASDFTYPNNHIAFGVDYSNKIYNFFLVTPLTTQNIGILPAGPVGPQGPQGPTAINGTNGTNGINGTNGTNGTDYTSNNLQKIIVYPTNFPSNTYTVTNADNNYSIIVDHGVNSPSILIPTGLSLNFVCSFIQKGTGNVLFITDGTTIRTPVGNRIKGQYYAVALEQEGVTNTFYLLGNTKV